MIEEAPRPEPTSDDDSIPSKIARYFLHGIVYSVIMFFATIMLLVVASFLIIIGSLIGLILGFGLIFITMGWLNASIAGFIWDLDVSSGWQSFLGHGLLLFVLLFIVHVPFLIFEAIYSGMAFGTGVIFFVTEIFVMAIVDGYVGKRVAGYFSDDTMSETVFHTTQGPQRFRW
ncbi:hypothetical protein EU520_00040 [Candidatus Thorarchaeota archaeon]|nr:MAG: hypothetical protein EU520_00040 [Candidatus Thorarchaeota archaeon]